MRENRSQILLPLSVVDLIIHRELMLIGFAYNGPTAIDYHRGRACALNAGHREIEK